LELVDSSLGCSTDSILPVSAVVSVAIC
jgi:hypothetical protein